MARTLAIVVWGTLVGGCVGDREAGTSTGAGSSEAAASDGVSETGAGATTDASTSTTGELVPTSTSAATAGDSSGFIVGPDGGVMNTCNVFTQDCPDGLKCAAWAEGGGSSWNSLKCVSVTGDQLPGEPCTAEGGGVSGLDDCIKGAMCWDVDAQGEGRCVEVCSGSERMPLCSDPLVGCFVNGDGVLALCLPRCEPLVQDCSGDDLCLPVSGSYDCVVDGSGDLGATFDPCEFLNGCDKGLLCIDPAGVVECDQDALGCCTPMCSLARPVCPGVGQECLPVYEPQPPGFEDIGYCSLEM